MASSITEHNQEFFNAAAHKWDQRKDLQVVADQAIRFFKDIEAFSADAECLDFGCGTGILSVPLAPTVKSILGVDAAGKMVEVYNAKAKTLSLSNISALALDLCVDADYAQISSKRFDVIFTQLVLHHIENVPLVFERLAKLLKPGGKLIVIDILKDENTHGGGFAPESIAEYYHAAGLQDVVIRPQALEMEREVKSLGEVRKFPLFGSIGFKGASE
ncbi:S-adenosyl-L-methionine-dependent methyltransferase [Gaertneriomyces semiglobifer]|nr:S-adenosyl-L-methionine-dependent methyltransferase [Gaertneriomyces semiglobifer]